MLQSALKLCRFRKVSRLSGTLASPRRLLSPRTCFGSSALQNSSTDGELGYTEESESSLAQQSNLRIQLLTDLLKCSTASATSILMRNKKLLDIKQEALEKNVGVLKLLFPIKDILRNPEILSFQFGTTEQRYHNLEECGVKNVTPGRVVAYQDIVAKPVYTLKRHRLIPTETDPAVHLLSYLDCPQSVQAEILSRLPLHYTVTMNLRDVKRSVLRSYLSWRLQCSPDRINTLIGKYPSIENRSLQFLRRTIEIVTNNFNFPLKKVVCLKML